jgi:DNA-binding transcriptional ArsR family regulator
VLHIHFTAGDLARTRLAPAPEPLWELVLSVHQLSFPQGRDEHFDPWRHRAAGLLRRAGLAQQVRMLASLVPVASYFPDCMTPTIHAEQTPGPLSAAEAFGAGIDSVLSTPKPVLQQELGRLATSAEGRPPGWLRELATGRSELLRGLGRLLSQYHRVVLAPYQRQLAAVVTDCQQAGAQAMTERGVAAMLTAVVPGATWSDGTVLSVPYPIERELRLDGRGLLLAPSYFAVRYPVAPADPALPPVLVHPVPRPRLWLPEEEEHEKRDDTGHRGGCLSTLLGETRAAVLRALCGNSSTSELAARLRVAPSTVSRHAAVLRDSGLVRTERRGTEALHSRTVLGEEVLAGGVRSIP